MFVFLVTKHMRKTSYGFENLLAVWQKNNTVFFESIFAVKMSMWDHADYFLGLTEMSFNGWINLIPNLCFMTSLICLCFLSHSKRYCTFFTTSRYSDKVHTWLCLLRIDMKLCGLTWLVILRLLTVLFLFFQPSTLHLCSSHESPQMFSFRARRQHTYIVLP